MADTRVTVGRPPVIVRFGENTAEAIRQSAIAAAAAADAQASASVAEAFAGPTFADTAAGLAGTSVGESFAVEDSGIVTVYLHEAGPVATEQRVMLTTAALADDDGATLIGTIFGALATLLALLLGGRTYAAAAFAAAMPNGSIFTMGGYQYVVDSAATGDSSATTDLGVDGIRPFGDIYPQHFGAVGDGATGNETAVHALRDYAALRSAAGNTIRIVWPSGRYVYTTSPNWAIRRLRMDFQGEVWLIKTGSGAAFILDGGASGGDNVYGMQIIGFPQIYDVAGNGHGVYARACEGCLFQLNVRGAGASFAGFYGEWLVDNDIDLIVSGLESGLYSVPGKLMHLTLRGANEESSYNRCRIRLSGFAGNLAPVGLYLDGALGNEFRGTIQNCVLGFEDTTNAWENLFYKVDFEANTADAEVHGLHTQFDRCDFQIGPAFKADSNQGVMSGGTTLDVTVESGATGTLLTGLTYNRQRVSGTGTVSDAGTGTRKTDVIDGKTGVWL